MAVEANSIGIDVNQLRHLERLMLLFVVKGDKEPGFDHDINSGTIRMVSVAGILERMRRNPTAIRFRDLCKVCDAYFGKPRQSGTSHRVYKTPWIGDPRVNIQNSAGQAKAYQVRQVLRAIDRIERENG